MVYYELEPFGTGIEDARMAMICTSVMNAMLMAHADPKKNPKWYQPEDFLPDYFGEKEEPKKQTVEEMKDILKAIAGVK